MNNNTILHDLKKYVLKKLHIVSIEEKLKIQVNQVRVLQDQIRELQNQVRELQIALVGATLDQYREESLYIQKNGLAVFPYQRVKKMPSVEAGIDETLQLPYVIHKGKNLYFPHSYSIDKCLRMYVISAKNVFSEESFVKNSLISI